MSWNFPFVVFRFKDNKVTQVFECADLQKAKYWIKYIAVPGDVMCRTTASPKHSKKDDKPEYFCHKESSGQPVTNEKAWEEYTKKNALTFEYPSQPLPISEN